MDVPINLLRKGKNIRLPAKYRNFSTWKDTYSDDIHWKSIGYSFPVYTEEYEHILKNLLKIQKGFDLNIGN
jgi:hypothetical protein